MSYLTRWNYLIWGLIMHITDTLDVSKRLQKKGFEKNEADAIATTTEDAMKNLIDLIDEKFDNKFDKIQIEIKTLKWTILYSIGFLTLFISILAITNLLI